MDFNRLYSDHQVLLVKARRAPTYGLRRSCEIAASDIAIRIGSAQRSLGAAAAQAWGDDEQIWEGRGGASAWSGSLVSAADDSAPANRGMMRFRKANVQRLPPDQAKRQGEITKLAFLLLGRETAIAFLNTAHVGLGARPLDLATASDAGRDRVEAEIGQLIYAHRTDSAAICELKS